MVMRKRLFRNAKLAWLIGCKKNVHFRKLKILESYYTVKLEQILIAVLGTHRFCIYRSFSSHLGLKISTNTKRTRPLPYQVIATKLEFLSISNLTWDSTKTNLTRQQQGKQEQQEEKQEQRQEQQDQQQQKWEEQQEKGGKIESKEKEKKILK